VILNLVPKSLIVILPQLNKGCLILSGISPKAVASITFGLKLVMRTRDSNFLLSSLDHSFIGLLVLLIFPVIKSCRRF